MEQMEKDESPDGGMPRRYTAAGMWGRLTVGRGDEFADRLKRGNLKVTDQLTVWFTAADLDDAELTARARDRLIERARQKRDEHIEAERRRRADEGPRYRMEPPPPVDPNPKPTSGEIAGVRRRVRFARCGGAAAGLLAIPVAVQMIPLYLLVLVPFAAVGYVWWAGGPAPATTPDAADATAAASQQDHGLTADATCDRDDCEPADCEPATCTAPPSVTLLKAGKASSDDGTDAARTTKTLNGLLVEHSVDAAVTGHVRGPTVTRYLLALGAGVPGGKVAKLGKDIGRVMGCEHEPWIGPVSGDDRLAVELPNAVRDEVLLGEVLRSVNLAGAGPLTIGLGREVNGAALTCDLTQMPHLLVAGATGAGKSVFLNSLICSPLVRGVPPEELRMLLIDPKRVELAAYRGIPHLLRSIVTTAQEAVEALEWLAGEGGEMDRRYALLEANSCKNITAFNAKARAGRATGLNGAPCGPMPYLLTVIDELADLTLIAKDDVESHVVRATQLARAAGIHLVVATQRPSVDVVTGLIKANMPSRLAFATASGTDSRVVLDELGAQCLLGKGDALFKPIGANSPRRLQAAMITDEEIDAVVSACKRTEPAASAPMSRPMPPAPPPRPTEPLLTKPTPSGPDQDQLVRAARLVIEHQSGSTSRLKRHMKVRHERAAELMDALETAGVVGPAAGNNPRPVLAQAADLPTVITRLTSKENS
jgi:S-DNA-T family DNA segregation ATPase FtsK/SpoIIIE